MTLLHRLASVTRWVLRRNYAEHELHEELRTFLEMVAAAKLREGIPLEEARRQALLDLGGLEQVKERVRTARHGAWLDEVGRDLRDGFRTFVRNPGVTLIVIVTLGLGIGANTAIFSLIDALLLRSLPVRNPQELVLLSHHGTSESATDPVSYSFSYPIVRAFDDQHEIFDGVAGFSGFSLVSSSSNPPASVPAALVTGGYYETLGLNPVLGRLLTREDDQRGAPLVAVISDGYWERRFVRNANVIGQTILLNDVSVTIVGITPRGFVGANVGAIADITMTVAAIDRVTPEAAPLLAPGNFWLRALARPRPGLSIAEVRARLAAVWDHIGDSLIAPQWPASRRKEMAASVFQFSPGGTGWTNLRDRYRKPLWVLMAAVAVVLLIACFNVASLLLARGSARQREIAVRLALGARRSQIVRQLLLESTILSLTGAALGVGLAWVTSRLLVNMISNGPFPVVVDLTPNWHILGFASATAVATAIVFGVAPAFQVTAAGPAPVLKDDTRISGGRSRLLSSLVSAQVALSLVLLVGAGLLLRTLENLQHVDPGFNREGVLLVDLEGRRTAAPRDLIEDIQRMPGVVSASVSTHTPMSGSLWSEPAVPAGQPLPDRDTATFVGAGPAFFSTLQIPLLAGRDFSDLDSAVSAPVAIVNERFAQRYLGNDNPVGRHLAARVRGVKRDLEIIGLAKNTNVASMRLAPRAMVYVSYAQLAGDFPTTLEIRANGPLGRIASDVQRSLQAKLPQLPIEVQPLAAQVDATMTQERMMATLAGAFGLLALTVASVGLYGLLTYLVARRTKEIGIRMALGAERTRIISLVLGNAARLVVIGAALGLPAAWATSRSVQSMLFGLTPTDPLTVGAAVLTLMSAALIAAFLPARRASRVDPLTSLRCE